MKKYLLFENKGHLEVLALFMVGASSKRDDASKIGRFGSGLKYSLAKTLRDKMEIRVFSGQDEIVIGTQPFTLRDKQFEAITINGQQTSLTTEMGPDWQWWQVIRELWCNALDEGGADYRVIEDGNLIDGRQDYTRVFIEINNEIEAVLQQWHLYFAHDREDVIVDTPEFRLYPSDGKQIYYRKGIRCHFGGMDALYHYDSADFPINEERVITSEFAASYNIATCLARHATFEVAQNILRNAHRGPDYFEATIEWEYGCELSPVWRDAARSFDHLILHSSAGYYVDLMANTDHYALISMKLAKRLLALGIHVAGITPSGTVRKWIELESISKKQEFLLNDTLKALQDELGYAVSYPIKLAEFTNPAQLAVADTQEKIIYLSPKLFDMGRRKIALAIMEEQEHIYEKLADETRDFQNHLFSKWLAALEEKAGYFF